MVQLCRNCVCILCRLITGEKSRSHWSFELTIANSHVSVTMIYATAIYLSPTYDQAQSTKEGKRGAADSFAYRSSGPPWIRDQQDDRAAFWRGAALQCRLALSAAVQTGGAWTDRRPLGGEGEPAPAALLPRHRSRKKDPARTAQHLEHVCRFCKPDHRNRLCLIGVLRLRSASRRCA